MRLVVIIAPQKHQPSGSFDSRRSPRTDESDGSKKLGEISGCHRNGAECVAAIL